MQQQFENTMQQYLWKGKRILVAVSGGVDSMVLAHLMWAAGFDMAIAHCNFGLRAQDSDADEELVKTWAQQNNVPFFIEKFNTPDILEQTGGNLQETARNLRYNWFKQLCHQHSFDYIATAHHIQDNAETMLINLLKGTGIAGLHGILPEQNGIIRPLLSFSKEQIKSFALTQKIPWREDESNKADKYLRNNIRHHLLPAIEHIFPNYLETLHQNAQRFREAELYYQQAITQYRNKLLEPRGKEWYLPVLKLKNLPGLHTLLWELFKPFGFSSAQAGDIVTLVSAGSGKFLMSATHKIIKDRNFLIVTPLENQNSSYIWINKDDAVVDTARFILNIKETTSPTNMELVKQLSPQELMVDAAQLKFPLLLRPWKQGDYFYPIGMQKKKKKLSKLLIEQKMPIHQKEHVWVLESDQKIVWVIGIRADERFKLNAKTANSLYISVNAK